ncbi:MAG: methyltransferase domain-containing protein [bacterium]
MNKSIQQISADNQITGRGYDSKGLPRPLSEREFFEVSEEMGCNQNNSDYRNLFRNLAAYIKKLPTIRSALEMGCGPGYLLYCLNKIGIDTEGVDGNSYSRDFFTRNHPEFAHKYHLDPLFAEKYEKADVFIAIECFEHIPDANLNLIMDKVCCEIQPEFILFSSTPHPDPDPNWDIQWGHVNIKQPDEWRDFFLNRGYKLTKEKPPVTVWASLYKRKRGGLIDVSCCWSQLLWLLGGRAKKFT